MTVLALNVFAPTLAQAESGEEQLLGNLEAARSFDYCGRQFDQSNEVRPMPDVSEYIEAGTRDFDVEVLPSAVVIDAGIRVATAAPDKQQCELALSLGNELVASIREQNRKGLRKQAKFRKSRDKRFAEIQAEITRLWMQDQLARIAYVQTKTDSRDDGRFWAHRIATADAVSADEQSSAYLRELLMEIDWIDIERVGRPVSKHAWLLVQHSDDHVDLQSLALQRMEAHVEAGTVLKRNYAYLWDRVAVNSGELQRYGTQPDWNSCTDGMLTLMPMEDPTNVDQRRAAMQLPPVQNDLQQMSQQTCLPATGN